MPKPIHEILTTIMEDRGISVAETARLCNLPDSTIRGILTRKQKSTALEVAFKLSKVLCVSLEYLNGQTEKEIRDTNINKIKIDISIDSLKIIQAYEKATLKEKNTIRQILDLPPLEPPAKEVSLSDDRKFAV